MSKVTMYDVARTAGVSQAAVSKVLNGKDPWVSASTRQRVLEAVRKLGYRGNYHARLLRTGKTNCLGVMGSLGGFALDNYVYTRVVRGIEDELAEAGSDYALILFSSVREPGQGKSLQLLERGLVDGVIWIVPAARLLEFERESAPWLKERRIPFVAVHSVSRAFPFPQVGMDSRAGGYLAARHLAGLGYDRIGLYLLAPDSAQSVEIREGWRQALVERGLPADEGLLFPKEHLPASSAFDGAYQAGLRLRREELPRALLVSLDGAAYGLWKAFRERGIRVPEDVALVGTDDELPTRYGLPELSTVHHPFQEKGREAVRMLAELLGREEPPEPPPSRILQPALIVRKTCGGEPQP